MILIPKFVRRLGFSWLDLSSRWQKAFPYIFAGFGALWSTLAFSGIYSEYRAHRAQLDANMCRIVEGPVQEFVPMSPSGHGMESFRVSGVLFQYSDNAVTDAFNNTASEGGPITSNAYVRICYDSDDHAILRLEIRDYTGPRASYRPPVAMVQKPSTGQAPSPRNRPPWDTSLFVYLGILEIAGAYLMFQPYLRTYFRFGPPQEVVSPISRALVENCRIVLRNCIAVWDRERGILWLRARGLNTLYAPPWLVAKLTTDALGTTITRREVRISPGIIVVFAAFLWGAYRMLSSVGPAGEAAPPVWFFGLVAVMMPISVYVGVRRMRTKLAVLIDDALTELRRPNSSR